MLTPFLSNGNIDYPALTQLTEIYLQAGASGLFANCLSSEMFELSDKERIQAIKHVIKAANGAVPVVATGTFGGEIAKQADFIKEVSDAGVEAVIAITSLLANEGKVMKYLTTVCSICCIKRMKSQWVLRMPCTLQKSIKATATGRFCCYRKGNLP